MRKIVLIYGLIGGLIIGGMMFITMPMYHSGTLNINNGMWVGYTTMIIGLSLVFFGVKKYRDTELGGAISFARALGTGMLISLVAGILYCLSWEICLQTVAGNFMQDYIDHQIAGAQASGATTEAIQALQQEMNSMAELYKNPFLRFGMTLMEILPAGIIVSLITALVLKRKQAPTL
ncbi:MAG: DUF4199 domain-containing protein [Flavobacteriales bacterium]